MELHVHSMTVPEGITIAPAHFLTAPEGNFKDDLEQNGHSHWIVKVNFDNGHFHMQKIDFFSKVGDRFCFATEKFKNQTLCYLTTTGFLPWIGRDEPYCKHGIKKKILLSKKTLWCPHVDGAFTLHLLCFDIFIGSETTVNEDKLCQYLEILGEKEVHNKLDSRWDINLSTHHKFKIKTEFGEPIAFSFLSLCQDNGKQVLGDLRTNMELINCKDQNHKPKIVLNTYREEEGKDILIRPKVLYINPCAHENDCTEAGASSPTQEKLKGKGTESSPSLEQNIRGEGHTIPGGNIIHGDATFNLVAAVADKGEDLSPKVTDSKP